VKTLVFAIFLIGSPVWAQTKLTAKNTRVDNCAPIGHTAKGELFYSMTCDNPPAPPPPPQADLEPATTPRVEPAPAPPVEESGGIFGWSRPGRPPPSAPAGQ
jgi:hypothetical protein